MKTGAASQEEEELGWSVRVVGRFRNVYLRAGKCSLDSSWSFDANERLEKEEKRTSMSLSLIISPVGFCPAGVGLSEVQLSHKAGAGAAAEAEGESTVLGIVVDSATGMSSSASLSGDLVATSGSAMMVTGLMEVKVIEDIQIIKIGAPEEERYKTTAVPSINAVDVDGQVRSDRWNDRSKAARHGTTAINHAPRAPTMERNSSHLTPGKRADGCSPGCWEWKGKEK